MDSCHRWRTEVNPWCRFPETLWFVDRHATTLTDWFTRWSLNQDLAQPVHQPQGPFFYQTSQPWRKSSLLHMVPKKTAEDWCSCGDYRALNWITTPTQFHTSTTSRCYRVPLSCLSWTWCERTTRFQYLLKMCPKQLSQHHLVCLSLSECLSALGMQHKHFNSSWTKFLVVYLLPTHTLTTSSLLALLRRSTFSTCESFLMPHGL